VFAGIGATVVAPIGEELFFRGFLYRGLRRRLAIWPAAAVSGVLFGLIHVDVTSGDTIARSASLVLPLSVMGLGLAWLCERRQSVLAPMAAHMVFNVIGFAAIALSR
jgi:membrane protease YdiL (CAAX protease family)